MLKSFKVFILLVLVAMAISNLAQASTTRDVFQKYPNPVFIESGSFYGDGIAMALEVGFKDVYSIELAQHLYEKCTHRFQGNPHVHLYFGDSSVVLNDILKNLNEKATFWLDGHYSEGVTAKGITNSPILQELALIATHPIKNHTILIDDIRHFGTQSFDFVQLDDIKSAIKKINPNYQFHLEDGYVPNDILVAEIK